MDLGNLGASQRFGAQGSGAFRDHESSQRRAFKGAAANGGGIGRQANVGQGIAACERGGTNGHGCAGLEGHLGQVVAVFKGVISNGNDVLTDMHLGDLGVALEHVVADPLQVGVQLT